MYKLAKDNNFEKEWRIPRFIEITGYVYVTDTRCIFRFNVSPFSVAFIRVSRFVDTIFLRYYRVTTKEMISARGIGLQDRFNTVIRKAQNDSPMGALRRCSVS